MLVGLLALVLSASLIWAAVTGADPVTAGTPVTLGTGAAGSVEAWGGNITAVNLTINSTTLHWQAFYGNITAGLRLASNQTGTLYTVKSWTVDNLRGVVFVSRGNNIDFTNLTTPDPVLENLDTAFPFLANANDRAAQTGTDDANPAMQIGSYSITANTRPIIQTSNSTSSTAWTQVILNDGNTEVATDYVFAVPINSTGRSYDNLAANYQVIVPANATSGTSATYYFYGEIQ